MPQIDQRLFKRVAIFASLTLAVAACDKETVSKPIKSEKPNIVLIMADDLGYGDIGAYNGDSKAPTPSLDILASEGMRFTDAHSPSSVCTPTRYALLTGRYTWRSRLKKGVIQGYARKLIEEGRETLGTLLQRQGYTTAAIGKWHLGLGNNTAEEEKIEKPFWDENGDIANGMRSVGFDYSYGLPSSLDFQPYFFMENDKLIGKIAKERVAASDRKRFGGNGFWREGVASEGFDFEEVLPRFTEVAVSYIHKQKTENTDNPFFLYMPLPAPHTPWMPTEQFRGISGAGPYGDFVTQVDDTVRQVLQALKDTGVEKDTLVIFTSDNGSKWPQLDIDTYDHLSNANWRGQKADIHEGGHRVPFIVKWPGKVAQGSESNQLLTLTDIMATFADYFDVSLTSDAGPDSQSILPVILGEGKGSRKSAIHHAGNGQFSIRSGDWKLIEGLGTGGFTSPRVVEPKEGETPYQLYNLVDDPAEKNNLADDQPETLEKLLEELNAIRNK